MSDIGWRTRLLRWLAGSLAAVLILMAVLVGAFRLLVPQVAEYREAIAAWAGEAIGAEMEIAEIDVRWRGLVPEILFRDVRLRAADEAVEPIAAEEIAVQASLLDLLRPGPVRPGRVVLRGGDFSLVREADGTVLVPGIARFEPNGGGIEAVEPVVERILARADYRIEASRFTYTDRQQDIGPWDIGVDRLSLYSEGRRHRLQGQLQLPEALGGDLQLSLEAEGPVGALRDWQWQGELDVVALALNWPVERLPGPWLRPLEGEMDLSGRLAGQGLTLESVQADVDVSALRPLDEGPVLRGPEQPPRGELRLHGIDWQAQRRGWRFSVADLALGGLGWPDSRIDLQWQGDRDNARVTANLRYLDLGDAVAVARQILSPGEAPRLWLDRLQPEGELRDVIGEVQLREGEPAEYGARARVTGLGMESWEDIPGFAGVTGWLRADEAGGHFELDAGPVVFDYPTLFRDPLHAERVTSRVDWQRVDAGWDIQASDIQVRNEDARVAAELGVDFRPGGPHWVTLEAEVPTARSDNLSRYLPVGRMPETAVDWLDHAILSGQARNGRVLVDGPTRPFPYHNGEGRFEIDFDVVDGGLRFDEDWPVMRDVDARVSFRGPGMTVEARQGRIAGYQVDSAQAHIDDLQNPEVEIEGQAHGELADGLRFLRDGPLAEWFGRPLADVSLQGGSELDLSLSVPVRQVADLRLDGEVSLSAVSGGAEWLPGEISALEGKLYFSEQAAWAESITGQHLGGAFRLALDPGSRGRHADEDDPPYSVAHIQGHSRIEALAAERPELAFLDRLDGGVDWESRVRVDNRPNGEPIQVTIDSQLKGLAVDLPEPLSKAAEESMPLSVRFPVGQGASRVELDYGGFLALTLQVGEDADGQTGVHGLRADLNQVREPDAVADGIRVAGRADYLSLLPWLTVDWTRGEADGGMALEGLTLDVDRLRLGMLSLESQGVSLDREALGWRVELRGDDASGELLIPADVTRTRSTVEGRLEHLRLRLAEAEVAELAAMDPRSLPSLDFQVERVSRNGMEVNDLALKLQAAPDGVILQQFSTAGDLLRVELGGEWRDDALLGERGRLTGRMESGDLAAALRLFDFVPGLESRQAEVDLNLSWHGPLDATVLGRLGGETRLRLGSGQLREVSPGAGRVVGLFSLQALPRRLFGDFRDVFGRGLRFDSISGDFHIADGDVFTGDLALEGPAVNLRLAGRTGLYSRDYDHHVSVSSPVGATLPVAGAIAGGVTLGAAMLVLSELFRGPLARVGNLEYRLQGAWEDPRVIPLDEEARRALDEE
ncbi:YhdP family protein [Gammaproteobacteria bacterium AB-CW1]|uniref:YhdP family protein n=1 Tax=Natronospira elongata TaxID=3110268 RepID=A0AAP6MKE6_9GAMM|nr:YhdP family protein [Gammaproteobacteria bacterium AB-CW1]